MAPKQPKQSKPKMVGRLTLEQYQSLPEWGKELHDYLQDYKKKTYKEWETADDLYRYLMSEGKRLEEMAVELIQDGLAEDQMREIVRAEIYGDLTE